MSATLQWELYHRRFHRNFPNILRIAIFQSSEQLLQLSPENFGSYCHGSAFLAQLLLKSMFTSQIVPMFFGLLWWKIIPWSWYQNFYFQYHIERKIRGDMIEIYKHFHCHDTTIFLSQVGNTATSWNLVFRKKV